MFYRILTVISLTLGMAAAATAQDCGWDRDLLSQLVPQTSRLEARGSNLPYCEIISDGRTVGTVLSTWDVVQTTGYSGKPIDILIALDDRGTITGAKLVQHQEPILIIGVAESDLAAFVEGFVGRNFVNPALDQFRPSGTDHIVGATVSSAVIEDGIIRAVRTVSRAQHHARADRVQPLLDVDRFAPRSWAELIADQSVASKAWSTSALNRRWKLAGGDHKPGLRLYLADASAADIGVNLIGRRLYDSVRADHGDAALIFIGGEGLYSFKGRAWRRSGVFETLQLVQDSQTTTFTSDQHFRIDRLTADGAPELREMGLFIVPNGTSFDSTKPWRLEVLLNRDVGDGTIRATKVALDYRIPAHLVVGGARAAPRPDQAGNIAADLWLTLWQERAVEILFVSMLLVALTILLFYQERLVAMPGFYEKLRVWYLIMVCFGLGFWIGGQLSVVNIFTYTQALLTDFQWRFFLLDPIAFILWSFVAVLLLFWGRGVFCGWLCPFGALQELSGRLGRWLGVKQIVVPFRLHERLWTIKYVIFLGLLAVSLSSIDDAFLLAEVEPFKTTFAMKFLRAWPFVVFALAMLACGLFIERFYCRYVCPLGAALSIPARLAMFRWLKRRHQCGAQCAICYHGCPVQAIHPEGEINPNECINCLACQVKYADDTLCPPLVKRRRRREQRLAGAAASQEKTP